MAAPLTLRRALLILDLQNEFLASSGRCKVSNFPIAPEKGPSFIDNILAFVTAFRKAGSGDIIWIRSEFTKPRDANDEKVLLYEEESEDGQETPEDRDQESDHIGKFDEFLSSTINPYCAKGSPAADFHESVTEATKTLGDRIIRKTWYSAFIKTGLVEILRGRLATELFICGLKTNISVFATVSDAVRHGFQVTVLDDCVGYGDHRLHDVALGQMAGVLGCEVTRSARLVGAWTAKTKPARSMSATQTKEDLAQMIERLSLSEEKSLHVSTGPLIPSKEALEDFALQQEQKKTDTRRQGVEEGKSLRNIKGIPVLLKEGDKMGEGDTRLVNGILHPDLENVAFERLRHEIRWRTMLHRGGEVPRLVAVEGDVGEDGRQVDSLLLFFCFFSLFFVLPCSHESLEDVTQFVVRLFTSCYLNSPLLTPRPRSAFPYIAILQTSLHLFDPFLLPYLLSVIMSKRCSTILSTMFLFNTIVVVMTTSLSIPTRPWTSCEGLLSLMSVLGRNER